MAGRSINFKFPTVEEVPDPDAPSGPSDRFLNSDSDYTNGGRTRERAPSLATTGLSNGHANGSWKGASPQAWTFSPSNGSFSKGGQPNGFDYKRRRRSLSVSALEIADALKAPVSPKFVTLCIIWYFSSATTNTSSKTILNAFPRPITLTLIQFLFVPLWCLLFSYGSTYLPALRARVPALRNGVVFPTMHVVRTTLPLAFFAVGGHILSSSATNKIDVSLVHTIKGMSPLFTVLAYRLYFNIHYSTATYLSLLPLTLGVMLACSTNFSGNFLGILFAFASSIVFVTQNMFSKKLFNDAAVAEKNSYIRTDKLDKLNLLCYSSSFAFLLTIPVWLTSEAFNLSEASPYFPKPKTFLSREALIREFLFNGLAHFAQNILAFILLSMVSPVTYSVASLVKRIFVVAASIFYFGNSTTPIQAAGIMLTFFGVYLYDRASATDRATSAGHRDAHGARAGKDVPILLPLRQGDVLETNGAEKRDA